MLTNLLKKNNIVQTFLARFLILALNFGLVIYSTNIWGSEGKGVISIVIANLTIVGFLSNIFAGGTITYFSSKARPEPLLLVAYLWSILIGITIPLLFYFFYSEAYILTLMGLSISASLLATNVNFFIGKQKFKLFNLYSILQLAIQIILIFFFVYFLEQKNINIYFISQTICNFLLFFISFISIAKIFNFSNFKISKKQSLAIFAYGYKTQFSAFTQFLNYRLSYYFLEFYKGVSSVGIYSIGTAFSEAIWVFSKSISVVLYSEVVNSKSHLDSIMRTKTSLKLCFTITFFMLFILLLLPTQFYTFVFGKDFNETKKIIILLSPGVLAIAASNIVGHYFSGVNELTILNIKSLVGLFFTITLSFFFIPKWGIYGACLVTSISYILSSAVLFWKFYTITSFKISDFIISFNEIKTIINKITKKDK